MSRSTASPAGQLSFRVDTPIDLAGWKPLAIAGGFPLETLAACPADDTPLATICTLVGASGRVRVGACPACGHVAYVDRPTAAWLAEFYRDTWDHAERNAAEAEIERRQAKLARDPGIERDAVRLARRLPLDRSRPVCEIGCGYGSSLKQLEAAGFARLVGTDASAHRAEVVRRAFRFEVLTGPFEAAETARALQARGPFGLVYTIHALEHTRDPGLVLASAARLQDAGDYLIVSVPHAVGEPTMSLVMFLPHLHAFTQASLVALAARHGYAVVDASFSTPRYLTIAFRREPTAAPPPQAGAHGAMLDKLVRGLHMDVPHSGRRRFWWLKKKDRGGQIALTGDDALDAAAWHAAAARFDGDTPRSMIVDGVDARSVDPAASPIEIQFRGDLVLFYK